MSSTPERRDKAIEFWEQHSKYGTSQGLPTTMVELGRSATTARFVGHVSALPQARHTLMFKVSATPARRRQGNRRMSGMHRPCLRDHTTPGARFHIYFVIEHACGNRTTQICMHRRAVAPKAAAADHTSALIGYASAVPPLPYHVLRSVWHLSRHRGRCSRWLPHPHGMGNASEKCATIQQAPHIATPADVVG